jgi:hypothetical protein
MHSNLLLHHAVNKNDYKLVKKLIYKKYDINKKDINNRLINIMDNSYTCPIVYEVLEDLKDMLWEKN